MATTHDAPTADRLRDLFTTGLKNAHGLEKQALSIMEPQVSRLENYPEVAERLRSHIEETNGQIRRLEEIMDKLDESRSALKDTAMSMAGGMAAIGHSLAGDEILKNSFANYAFENYEIASYKSLIVLAEDGGFRMAVPLLQETLTEEQRMAEWINDSLPMITRRYAELSAQQGSFAAKV
jgi:ferritin-like metal-binding protein YciE